MPEDRINVIAVVGPTAVGKTRVAIEIAKSLGGEIVSADSMQIYRKMDLGTGRVEITISASEGLFYRMLSETSGENIENDLQEQLRIFR